MSRFFPEEYERFVAGADRAADVVPAYARMLGDQERVVRERAALAWARWEVSVLSVEPNAKPTSWSTRVDDELIEFVSRSAR